MTTAPADPRMALDAASSQDLVQRKLSIDAMRKRVSGGQDKDGKLREACDGFEAMFLQKMWEQMRKNVKKEGYLHSKDEEAYQSMFDVELAKKMASAGGIGLGDMLYEQLNQRLNNTSKTTGAGNPGKVLPITPAPEVKRAAAPEAQAPPANLYSEVETAEAEVREEPENVVTAALAEFAQNRDPGRDPAAITYPMFDMRNGAPLNPVAGRIRETSVQDSQREVAVNPLPERVSAPGKARPSRMRNMSRAARSRKNAQAAQSAAANAAARTPATPAVQSVHTTEAAGMTVSSRWPVAGDVSRRYGWEFNEKGNRTWNTGMAFAAAPGSPVTAPMEGTVAFVGKRDDTGMTVILEHGGNLRTIYGNAVTELAVGDTVSAGMQFATVGADAERQGGDKAGNLSFSIRRGELALNPEHVLAGSKKGNGTDPA